MPHSFNITEDHLKVREKKSVLSYEPLENVFCAVKQHYQTTQKKKLYDANVLPLPDNSHHFANGFALRIGQKNFAPRTRVVRVRTFVGQKRNLAIGEW